MNERRCTRSQCNNSLATTYSEGRKQSAFCLRDPVYTPLAPCNLRAGLKSYFTTTWINMDFVQPRPCLQRYLMVSLRYRLIQHSVIDVCSVWTGNDQQMSDDPRQRCVSFYTSFHCINNNIAFLVKFNGTSTKTSIKLIKPTILLAFLCNFFYGII